jgi:hypothetical protein
MQKQSRFRRLVPLSVAVAALWSLSPLALFAHHGWAGYLDAEFEISGTVETPVSLAGPHAALTIRAADGKVWNVVLAPPPRTTQAGLKEGIIPIGATVIAHGHRHRNANRLEIKTERLTWGDRVFNVYPDRK